MAPLENALHFGLLGLFLVTFFPLKTTAELDVWTPIGLSSRFVEAIVVDPRSDQTIYAGTYLGIYKTVDGGENWTLVSSGAGEVLTLAIDPSSPDFRFIVITISSFDAKSTTRGVPGNPETIFNVSPSSK